MKCCMVLSLLQLAYGLTMCPDECSCNTDTRGRLQIICSKFCSNPNSQFPFRLTSVCAIDYLMLILCLFSLAEGLKTIPVQSLDPNLQVLVISGSKNPLTISPIFIPFTKLEVLQINDASLQAIGVHSFWGVQSLRVLGKIINQCWYQRRRKCASECSSNCSCNCFNLFSFCFSFFARFIKE